MASKSRPNLSENPNKASLATPRATKVSKVVSKSESGTPPPLQNSRLSLDRSSPRSVNSKATIERKSARTTSSPADKPAPRAAKGSELQNQLNVAQEDLKKANEQILQAEKEKVKAIDELKEAQRLAEEANEKLREALVAQKQAKEESEIEKFRAVELEQAGIETVKKKEEEWQKELESVRNQHALDVASLASITEELQRVKQELDQTCDAKYQALSHADEATKMAKIHAEKEEIYSAELARLKALLDSKQETQASESDLTLNLKSEIDALKQELEKAKGYDEKLAEKETHIEQLNMELEAAKMAESYAHSLLEEWKKNVEELEISVEEANRLERSASESLESVMKQLEGSNDLLHDAESEVAVLKEKVGLLEMTIARQKTDVEGSERQLLKAKEENLEKSKKIESLISELETVKEEKDQALNNEQLAASSVQTLLEEKNKLINDLENSREEEEKSKKAMESLASALHEVSAEAREAKENTLNSQAERQSYENQIEDLKLVLKGTNEKYESMLGDARNEIDVLICSIENSKNAYENSKSQWEQREFHLVNSLKKAEEENVKLEKEINRLVYLLKQTEEEANVNREEEAQLKENLKEVESETIHLQEALKEVTAENMKLKENVLDKENELQNVFQENDELRAREAESIKKVEELSKLLEEATTRNHTEENGDLTDSEKDYDLLPKVVEFSEENGHGGEDISKVELSVNQEDFNHSLPDESFLNYKAEKLESPKHEEVNEKLKEDDESKEKDDPVEVEFKMWESCKIEKKEFSPDREVAEPEPEPESVEEEVGSKIEEGGGESFDKIHGTSITENIEDGGSSPLKEQQQQQLKKKKKALLGKFGSLLKKKGASNQK